MEARSDASPEQQFVFSRRFDAPRALVWKAWSEPERFVRWWGPKGCTIKLGTMEFRPGGVFHYAMQWQGVPDMWGKFVYERIVPEHSIEFISSFSDADGHLTRAPSRAWTTGRWRSSTPSASPNMRAAPPWTCAPGP
jgi:uncharacterized protein YndB with AHSA1/START domain